MGLVELIKNNEIVLFDGGMGTELLNKGLEPGTENNLLNPKAVLEVHRSYAAQGCQVLITNTLTANPIYFASQHHELPVADINKAGVELAKEASHDCFVVGDMSSTGQLLQPFGLLSEKDAYEAFVQQAKVLASYGVDGFIIETMVDLQEAICALKACQDISDLPVIVSMTFSTITNGCRTVMGNKASDIALSLEENGATAIGANCGDLAPDEFGYVVEEFRQATTLPILIQPNAGKPTMINGVCTYNMPSDDFVKGLTIPINAGANLIGGCCGTSPEHIQAVAASFK